MRIAYVVSDFPLISETFVVRQIAGMVARGCDVDILAMSDGPTAGWSEAAGTAQLMNRPKRFRRSRYPLRLYRVLWSLLVYGWRAPGPALHSLNVRRFGRSAATLNLLDEVLMATRLDARRYDVIHAQFGWYGNVALRLRETGVISGRLVTSFRGCDATKHLRENPRTYDELFRKGDFFLPVNEALAARIIGAGCERSRVQVHHSGIECARLVFEERRRAPSEATRAIMIGRLVEKKGIGYGVRAVARAVASGRSVSCTVVGDGPMRGELEQLIRELDVGAYVRLIGARSHDEVLRLLAQSHLLIAPSVAARDGDEEGTPNCIKEAMAMGLPVVSTWHGGIPELVEDGLSGFLVPEHDVEALTDRLMHLIDYPKTWTRMGRAGRRCVEVQYDSDKLNDELLALYKRLVGASPSAEGGSHSGGLEMPRAVRRTGDSGVHDSVRYH